MTINKSSIKKKSIIFALTAVLIPAAFAGTVRADSYYISDREGASDDNTHKLYIYTLNYEFTADGDETSHTQTRRIIVRKADEIWFDEPVAEGCDYCSGKIKEGGYYKADVFMDSSKGSYFENSGLKIKGLGQGDYDKVDVGLTITQMPGEVCPYCNRRIGETLKVGKMYIGIPYVTFYSQPDSVTVSAGEVAEFDVDADCSGDYRWGIVINGQWNEIEDGEGPFGEYYSGSGTSHLVVSNTSGSLDGKEYKCRLAGVYGRPVFTDGAGITVAGSVPDHDTPPAGPTASPTPEPVQPTKTPVKPTQVPSEPTKTPTKTPVNPTQAPDPTQSPSKPTPAVITPAPGVDPTQVPMPTEVPVTPDPKPSVTPGQSSSSYRPKSSSSTMRPKEPEDDGGSSTRKSSSNRKQQVIPESEDIVILPADDEDIDPDDPRSLSSSRRTSKRTDRKGSSRSGGSTGRGRTGMTSRIPGSSTIVKDGILYIIDDDSISPEAGPDASGRTEENVDMETAYSAADLAIDAEQTELSGAAHFWRTLPGYLTIIGIILFLLILALFFLFFGVIVTGEVEENDEVFELCAVRLMKRRDGNWCVNLGSAFDDNAVLKLRIGILFAVIFEEWELTGEATGLFEGEVTGQISQNMLMYRKNIRRCV